MELYFLDDGSLIISEIESLPKCITLVEEVEIVRTIGCHYLSGLSGKEAYDILVEKFCSLDKNGVSSCEESIIARDKEDK